MPKMKKSLAFDFEKGLAELEKIVEEMEKMEQESFTLEDSLAQFSQATYLVQQCQMKLKGAEQRVQILLNHAKKNTLEPFEIHEELS